MMSMSVITEDGLEPAQSEEEEEGDCFEDGRATGWLGSCGWVAVAGWLWLGGWVAVVGWLWLGGCGWVAG